MEWGAEQETLAREKVRENSSEQVSEDVRGMIPQLIEDIHNIHMCTEGYEREAAQHWHTFYQQHQNKYVSCNM